MSDSGEKKVRKLTKIVEKSEADRDRPPAAASGPENEKLSKDVRLLQEDSKAIICRTLRKVQHNGRCHSQDRAATTPFFEKVGRPPQNCEQVFSSNSGVKIWRNTEKSTGLERQKKKEAHTRLTEGEKQRQL